jgi:galactokinase
MRCAGAGSCPCCRTKSDLTVQHLLLPDEPVLVARAPGRLDVMGGIADYSGAVVLQLPLARATSVVLQRQPSRRCDVATRRGDDWEQFSIEVDRIRDGELGEPGALAKWFASRADDRWAAYVIGVVQYCVHRAARDAIHGLRLVIDSTVPEGKGVSSSAALEVATMSAVAASYNLPLAPAELASACQWVENHVVGAPCGIMDQMTSACGERDRLLRLRCQPATIEGYVAIPRGYRFYGIDSGVRHAVTGADYGTVRTAAFMGYRMIAEAAGLSMRMIGDRVEVDDPLWHGYLANIPTNEFETRFERVLPERMLGDDFLSRYAGITDSVTRVDRGRDYPVRQATRHPVFEQQRVERFAVLLDELARTPAVAHELGQLMLASHASYGACGLGSEATDRLVELVMEAGPDRGLFGAKITGGGSGGTVAVLGSADAEPVIRQIAAEYSRETGRTSELFVDSGPGAAEIGVVRLEHPPA